ncbi:gluconate 2-dehydrogenase subunit 3 family protein [Aneurinibacillus tyrosinisolvens]|uniref:gluconate 2-dehydrogenase subunit 3 family protein n=1 Tax=Aneurinibacillus tyrosinisolvens TaxID=1443435 RepID=UPI00063F7156|nr:gluconate 2-dehydrogenase subunit 3 family protein [Aneurinibacillus tyrosinisolvens]
MSKVKEVLPTFMFFNKDEARTIEAMASRIIPGDPLSPGAREAGAVIYIDRALSGYYRHLQTFYRKCLLELRRYCEERYGGPFVELDEEHQDNVLSEIEGFIIKEASGPQSLSDKINENSSVLAQFFAVVREHTFEGTFCDPLYGGNRNAVGWKLIGFPGAQWGYTAEQMQLGFDATQIEVLTLEDLQIERNRSTAKGVKQ